MQNQIQLLFLFCLLLRVFFYHQRRGSKIKFVQLFAAKFARNLICAVLLQMGNNKKVKQKTTTKRNWNSPPTFLCFRTLSLQVVRAASPALLRVIALGAFCIYCTVSASSLRQPSGTWATRRRGFNFANILKYPFDLGGNLFLFLLYSYFTPFADCCRQSERWRGFRRHQLVQRNTLIFRFITLQMAGLPWVGNFLLCFFQTFLWPVFLWGIFQHGSASFAIASVFRPFWNVISLFNFSLNDYFCFVFLCQPSVRRLLNKETHLKSIAAIKSR